MTKKRTDMEACIFEMAAHGLDLERIYYGDPCFSYGYTHSNDALSLGAYARMLVGVKVSCHMEPKTMLRIYSQIATASVFKTS